MSEYICQNCKKKSQHYFERCPNCGKFRACELVAKKKSLSSTSPDAYAIPLSDVPTTAVKRIDSGSNEINYALGGGFVPGQVILLAAPPGMGKSTVANELTRSFVERGESALYVAGEESAQQIRMRTDRTNTTSELVYVLESSDLQVICREIHKIRPDIVIIDSIQTVTDVELNGSAGSTSQVKNAAEAIIELCKKKLGCVCVLIAHVTKDDSVAGPRTLEHAVDTTMFIDGDKDSPYRYMSPGKNRFGPVGRAAHLEMTSTGMCDVVPGKLVLESRLHRTKEVCGSVFSSLYCGQRPSLIEIQALVTSSGSSTGKRIVEGVPLKRVQLVLATMQKHLGISIISQDLQVKTVGGVLVGNDPLVDLALAMAIISSIKETPFPSDYIVFGEIGLTGEIAPANKQSIDARTRAVSDAGFSSFIHPGTAKDLADALLQSKMIDTMTD